MYIKNLLLIKLLCFYQFVNKILQSCEKIASQQNFFYKKIKFIKAEFISQENVAFRRIFFFAVCKSVIFGVIKKYIKIIKAV